MRVLDDVVAPRRGIGKGLKDLRVGHAGITHGKPAGRETKKRWERVQVLSESECEKADMAFGGLCIGCIFRRKQPRLHRVHFARKPRTHLCEERRTMSPRAFPSDLREFIPAAPSMRDPWSEFVVLPHQTKRPGDYPGRGENAR